MRNRAIFLLLMLMLWIPFLIQWQGNRDRQRSLTLETLREYRRKSLSLLDRAALEHSPEIQMGNLFSRFWQEFGAGTGPTDTPSLGHLRIGYQRAIRPFLPPHDFFVVDLRYDQRLLLEQSRLKEFSGALPDFLQLVASDTRPASESAIIAHRLQQHLQQAIPGVIQRGYQRKWQFFGDVENPRALFWDILAGRFLLLAYLDARRLPAGFVPTLQAFTWSDPEIRLLFLPFRGQRLLGSRRPPSHPEWRGLSPSLATRLRNPRFSFTAVGGWGIGALPARINPNYRVLSLVPLRVNRVVPPSRQTRNLRLFLLLSLALAALYWRFYEWERRRDVSVRVILVLTFLAATVLPLSSLDYILDKFLAEMHRNEKYTLGERLHRELTAIDDGGRQNLASYTAFLKSLDRLERFSPYLPATFPRHLPSDTPGRERFFLETLAGLQNLDRLFFHIFLAVQEDRQFVQILLKFGTLIPCAGKDFLITQLIQRADERFPLFQLLDQPSQAPPVTRSPTESERGNLEKEMVYEMLLRLIGPSSFISVIQYPERVFEMSVLFNSNYILETVFRSGEQVTSLLYWFWSSAFLEEKYLKQALPDQGLDRSTSDCLLGLIGFRDEYEIIPRTLSASGPTNLLAAARNTHLTRSYYHQEEEDRDGTFLVEALPARHVKAVLAGRKSTAGIEDNRAHRLRLATGLVWVFLGAALLLGLAGSLFFLLPLQRIIAAIQSIRAGNFTVRLDESRNDEFGRLGGTFNHMAKGLEEGFFLRGFVSTSAQNIVKQSGGDVSQGLGETIAATILFSALHRFTPFQTRHAPQEVFAMLNRHLEYVNLALHQTGGEIDKVIGEKIMIVFRHQELGGDALAALRAAEAAKKILTLAAADHFPLGICMGLNSGTVVSGVLGASSVHLDFTVIGDPVNVAARLASLAETFPTPTLLLSGETRQLLGKRLSARNLPVTQVKGKSRQIEVFQSLDH